MFTRKKFEIFGCNGMFSFEKQQALLRKIFSFIFRIKVTGLENLDYTKDRILIVPNYTSYIDSFLIALFVNKKITFSITDKLANKWWVKILTFLTETKFLNPSDANSIRVMVNELKQNKPCMILTESNTFGATSHMKVYEPTATIATSANAKILPVQIKGLRDSVFSRREYKIKFNIFPKVTIEFQKPVSLCDEQKSKKLTFKEKRIKSSTKLYEILMKLRFESNNYNTTVISGIIHGMRLTSPRKKILEDVSRKQVSYYELFMKSFIIGGFINRKAKQDEIIGLIFPTSAAGVMSFMGTSLYGKIPAMINFSAAPGQVISACKTANVKKVVTAHKIVEMAKLEPLIETLTENNIKIIYLEELKTELTIFNKLTAFLGAIFPSFMYKLTAGRTDSNSPAVVLFTSGSEGVPKAVALSHKNVLSNIYQGDTKFDFLPRDVAFCCLPMFHAYGFTCATILPLVLGVKLFAYPTPLHYKVIPGLCGSVKGTFLFSTETFLLNYAKYATPYDFNSIRIAVPGAEKITDSTKELWLNKFGVRLMEGYGATECSPIISVNNFIYSKAGSVGTLMTGMEYKLRKIEGITKGAELLVKGPNIMLGYIKDGKLMKLDDWYATGDIVEIDNEGYIFIKGRYKRFAKIGGEMVSLLAVENIIKAKWTKYSNIVVSVPHKTKGEQIIVLTNNQNLTKSNLLELFDGREITKLAMPKEIIYMSELPLLNSGKVDYLKAKQIATDKFS